MQKLPELLCPAGDMERLQTAVRYGADAVYLGGDAFGMRAAPQNFTYPQLCEAVRYAHAQGVAVHLTVNTLPRCDETAALPDFLLQAGEAGVDALIVADLGVLALARRLLPKMPLHASTQTGIVNELTANMLHELGVGRVVLARELTLEEIKTIRARTPKTLELEAFIHGAMCMSVSGRCVLSNYLTGRDANRGACAQPCRWSYHLMEEKRPGIFLPVFEDAHGSTILNAKDLCMIAHLRALAEAGVTSFKIEGRAKSPYYVGVVTNAYRAALDAAAQNEAPAAWMLRELETVSHREYSTGFFFGREPLQQSYRPGGYVQEWEFTGVVQRQEQGRLFLEERNRFAEGDTLELLLPGQPPQQLTVRDLRDDAGMPLPAARHPLMQVSFACDCSAPQGAMLRRKKAQ